MNDAPNNLDALRTEINTVDDALHDLLMQRAALVTEIGALKTSEQAAVFRPAREAALLRRLLARNSGKLPDRAVLRIWNEIIATSTRIQGGLTVAYCPIGDEVTGDKTARGRFGNDVSAVAVPTPAQVINTITRSEADVGLVPMPLQDDSVPWWPLLYGRTGGAAVQVIAAVPFVPEDDGEELTAFVVALGQPEPSGDDRTLVVLECDDPFSRDRVREVLADHEFTPGHTVSYDDPTRPGAHLHLVDIDGFVALDDPRLLNVRRILPASSAWHVGMYAAPFVKAG